MPAMPTLTGFVGRLISVSKPFCSYHFTIQINISLLLAPYVLLICKFYCYITEEAHNLFSFALKIYWFWYIVVFVEVALFIKH